MGIRNYLIEGASGTGKTYVPWHLAADRVRGRRDATRPSRCRCRSPCVPR